MEPTPLGADFWRLLVAQVIATFGDALTSLTLVLLINQVTGGSNGAIALLTVLMAVPGVLFGLLAGVVADRYDRRRLMLASDLVRAALVLGLLLVHDRSSLWLLYALAATQASVGTFFMPARGALVQALLPPDALMRANSLAETGETLAQILGGAAAGILVGFTNAFWPSFTLDALTFVASFALVWGVKAPAMPARGEASHMLAELREGLVAIRDSRLLRGFMLVLSLMFLGASAMQVLMSPFVLNVLHVPVRWVGLLGVGTVAGTVLGGLGMAKAGAVSPIKLITGGLWLFAAVIAGIGLSTNPWELLALNVGFGMLMVFLPGAFMTLTQQAVDNALMGRVGATFGMVASLTSLLSMAAAGTLAGLIGVREVFWLSAAITALAALASGPLLRAKGS